MDHPRFASGNITTAFIAEEYPDGFQGVTLMPPRCCAAWWRPPPR
jgi:propionyl-CoA carboxylase alpha chain